MSTQWRTRPEGGGLFAIWLIRAIARVLGRGPARLLLYPITLYFLLVRGPERRASQQYLARVLGRPARLREVARHIHTFASVILDRVFLLTGHFTAFKIETHGLEALHQAMDQGRGVLLLGAHVGSFEALRVLSQTRPDVKVRVVFDRGQNPAITHFLEALNPGIAETVIDAGQSGTAIVIALKEAADQGALIGLLGDRVRGGEPALECDFLGQPAPFPTAPILIAAALRIPVVLCFGLYQGNRRYHLHFELFSEGLVIPRRDRQAILAAELARYAGRLEHFVRLAPFNWFNFFDFWQSNSNGKSDPAVERDAGPDSGIGAS